MLDGERSFVRSESVQKTRAIAYDRRRHAVVALSSYITPLSALKKERKERGEIVDPVGPVADKKITLPKLENDSKKLDYAKSTLKVK